MESVYMPTKKHNNVTDLLVFRQYFMEFTRTVDTLQVRNRRKNMKFLLDELEIAETLQQKIKSKFRYI